MDDMPQPEEIYAAVWSHDDLIRDFDEPQEDPPREYWVVLNNGRLIGQWYPSEAFALAAARGQARAFPFAIVEYCQVQISQRTKV